MTKLKELSDAGVSIWLDDLSRARITSGNLSQLMVESSVVGVTTNPSIFQAAISGSDDYQSDVDTFAAQGLDAEGIITELTTEDVRNACDLFTPTYTETGGQDGRVSIEVDPRLAHQGNATIAQAKELWEKVDRPNAMIKIPATKEGLGAITEATAAGISVNVTLIFSDERYREVADAYLTGLVRAAEAGIDLSSIRSVASFFVSRVDTEIDRRLEAIGSPDALGMRGQAAIANARVAYGSFIELFEESERFRALASKGANVQRPLWASTGVKNPAYSATMYVDQLVTSNVVNTMPEKTMQAVAESANITGDTVRPNIESARQTLAQLTALGIDLADVSQVLEDEGVEKFETAWIELIEAVQKAMS